MGDAVSCGQPFSILWVGLWNWAGWRLWSWSQNYRRQRRYCCARGSV